MYCVYSTSDINWWVLSFSIILKSFCCLSVRKTSFLLKNFVTFLILLFKIAFLLSIMSVKWLLLLNLVLMPSCLLCLDKISLSNLPTNCCAALNFKEVSGCWSMSVLRPRWRTSRVFFKFELGSKIFVRVPCERRSSRTPEISSKTTTATLTSKTIRAFNGIRFVTVMKLSESDSWFQTIFVRSIWIIGITMVFCP